MIPDFKTYIGESAWGDMRKRSSGKVIRKENMVKTNEELRIIIYKLYKEQGEGDTLDVTSIALGKKYICDNLYYLFGKYSNVKRIIGLDTWDVSNVTTMKYMFYRCENLTELNIGNWDVSNVTDMWCTFSHCENLTELNIGNWDVRNVTDMSSMFNYCRNLTKLNISNWDVSNVTNMSSMFNYCENLTKLNISNWDVSNVTNMCYMFNYCEKLTELNIDNWDVSKVADVGMFEGCEKLNKKPKWYE